MPFCHLAENGAGIAGDRPGGRDRIPRQSILLTYLQTGPALGAMIFDYRLFFHQMNGLNRTVPYTEPATDTFIKINNAYFLTIQTHRADTQVCPYPGNYNAHVPVGADLCVRPSSNR